MTDTTLGRRIAQRRRMLSLSQEAFGEKMGVSRQAISKWEADAAVPEVDRLVQMSKLFGVSVGWLLGAEEEKEEAPAADTTGLAEKILSTLQPPEPLPVRDLPEPSPPPPAPRRRDWLGIGCVALSLISLLLSVLCLAKLRSLPTAPDPSAELEALSQKISQLEEAQRSSDQLLQDTRQWIASLIDPSSDSITSGLASYESLSQWSLTAQLTQDLTHAQVTFRATATQTPSSAQLVVQKGTQILAKVDCTLEGDALQAQVELAATDGCEYLLMLYDREGIVQMLTLQGHGLEDLEALSQPHLHILEDETSTFDNHSTERFWIGWEDMYLSASSLTPADADLLWKSLTICYYYNDTFMVSHDLTEQALADADLTARDLHFSCPTLTYQMGGFREGDLHQLRLEGTLVIDGTPMTFSLPLISYEVDDEDLVPA